MTNQQAMQLIKETYFLYRRENKTAEQEFRLQENLKKIRTYNLMPVYNNYYFNKKIEEKTEVQK